VELVPPELMKQLRNRSKRYAICKFFNPAGGGTWIISHIDADEDTMWGLVDLGMDCCEEGTVSLAELKAIKLPFGLGIERDVNFDPKGRTLADFLKLYYERGTLAGVA
jgi:hypothetical protein